MMSNVRDLYQEVIVDHYRHPHHCGRLVDPNRHADGFNPLCGDHLSLSLKVVEGIIEEVSFEGAGCAISTASASLMSDAVQGKSEAEAEQLFADFRALVTGAPAPASLGKLDVLAGVLAYPNRIKCATLAWHTLHAALQQISRPVTTEEDAR